MKINTFARQNIRVYAEIGINHNGKYNQAMRLIEAAAAAGVSGVKFQYRNIANAYSEGPKQIGDEILIEEIRRNYLSPLSILQLVDYAQIFKIEAGISFFDERDLADFGGNIHRFDFFKVPSVELCNLNLVNALLLYGKQVYVSLGCHNEGAIESAISRFSRDNWIAMHCVSNYPVSITNPKLGYLRFLKKKWGREFGYSSHDENWETCLIAMTLGASVIERHITLDKQAMGLDHSASSTPDEFRSLVSFASNLPIILSGDGPRIPNQGEKLNLQNLGRSYYATEDIEINQRVSLDKLSLHSPHIGLGHVEIQQFLNTNPIKTVKAGAVLTRSSFEKELNVPEEAIQYAREKKLALPVRLHDQNSIEKKFPIGAFEFHLSFREVLEGLSSSQFNKQNNYSVHLPDYINSTQLLDLFSSDKNQADESRNILSCTADFTRRLQDMSGKQVPIIGSFSVLHNNLEYFYEQYASLMTSYAKSGVTILPQWLPPIAWYFGGSIKLEVFNQLQDIELIKKYKLPICMDVCHLLMGARLYHFEEQEVIKILTPNIKHLHIADASGIDGEGIQFGEGSRGNMDLIRTAMDIDCVKVIEVWQGHLDDGAGFAIALTRLAELSNED